MKKRLIIISVIFALALPLFSACGCSSREILSFDNRFSGKTEIAAGYSQTLIYDVEYKTDEEGYAISQNFPDETVLKLEYGVGTAEFAFTAAVAFPAEITSDLKAFAEEQNALAYKLSYSFTIPLKVTLNGESQDVEEKMESETYFMPANLSFAPVYSKTESQYFLFSSNKTAAAASRLKIRSETVYNEESFSVTSYTEYLGFPAEDKDFGEPQSVEKKYDFRKEIDNGSLLFAIRGITADKDTGKTVPVNRFGETSELTFTKKQSAEMQLSLTYNGTAYPDAKFSYDDISYRINDAYSAGTAHRAYIQSGAVKSGETVNIPDLALPIVFFQPMQSVTGEFDLYGCLKFTLKEVTVNG